MNNKGVSFIFAVVLMVMLSVIISLVLWGHLTSITEPLSYKFRAIEVIVTSKNSNHLELTYIGGKDSPYLSKLIFKGVNSSGYSMRFYSSANSTHNSPSTAVPNLILVNPHPGAVVQTDDCTNGEDQITVVAEFRDGTVQVVLDVLV